MCKQLNGKSIYLKLVLIRHTETVDPVVVGFGGGHSLQSDYDRILPIHGDAAVAGQGVVYEVLQMGGLPGYYTGGTIHFVINNQIGFTTDFDDARIADYCTSVAAMVQAPVLHVNGDDAEAVVKASRNSHALPPGSLTVIFLSTWFVTAAMGTMKATNPSYAATTIPR